MAEKKYLDFDLLIEHSGENYTARVINSPAGQATIRFVYPFSELELENFLLKVGRPRRGVRRIDSPEMEAAKVIGGRLFETIFEHDVRGCLRSSLDEAERRGAGLRIRLRTSNAPELFDLPWEYLYNPTLNRFFSLSIQTPIVRYIDLPEHIRPLAVQHPLRVLVMISNPHDYPRLDVEQEWEKLAQSLGKLERNGLVEIEKLENATLVLLQRQLRRNEYHIFHFIGHGGFDQQQADGVLVLEDQRKRGRLVSGQYLGTVLHNHRPLRLAILNACEGARASRNDPFAGTAQSLVQLGIPAVIAMQFEITDEAAITFGQEFYAAVADGYPVDAALVEARTGIFAQGNDVEWGTPVLYLRSPDGCIFDINKLGDEEQRQSRIAALLRKAQAAMAEEDWQAAIETHNMILAINPTHKDAARGLKKAEKALEHEKKRAAVSEPVRGEKVSHKSLWYILATLFTIASVAGGWYYWHQFTQEEKLDLTAPVKSSILTPGIDAVSIKNMEVTSGRTYFTARLQDKSIVYTDRNYRYTKIPPFLEGKTYIITANDDKFGGRDSEFLLQFHVDREVTIYVAHSDRYTRKPDWLSEFQDTNADLTFAVVNDEIILSLYEKRYPAGKIVLEGNVTPTESENHAMYTVVLSENNK